MKIDRKLFCLAALILSVAFLFPGCSTGTGESGTGLLVLYTIPVDGGNVSRDAVISVVFNKDIDERTISGDSFYLTDSGGNRVPGTIEYLAANRRLTFTSENYYEIGETYSVYLTTAIKSTDSINLAREYIFNFTVNN